MMDFSLTDDQLALREAVERICSRFDDAYWLERDTKGGFPDDFYKAFAEAGFLGVAMPETYGGSGLGITEAAINLSPMFFSLKTSQPSRITRMIPARLILMV